MQKQGKRYFYLDWEGVMELLGGLEDDENEWYSAHERTDEVSKFFAGQTPLAFFPQVSDGVGMVPDLLSQYLYINEDALKTLYTAVKEFQVDGIIMSTTLRFESHLCALYYKTLFALRGYVLPIIGHTPYCMLETCAFKRSREIDADLEIRSFNPDVDDFIIIDDMKDMDFSPHHRSHVFNTVYDGNFRKHVLDDSLLGWLRARYNA